MFLFGETLDLFYAWVFQHYTKLFNIFNFDISTLPTQHTTFL